MNRLIILLLMTLTAVGSVTTQAGVPKDGKPLQAVRKYQILVTNEDSVKNIKSFNNQLHAFQNEATAQANGLPPNVLPCEPTVNAGANVSVVNIAPIGMPQPNALADVKISG